MKKEYKSPWSVVSAFTTDSMITASGDDTIQETVSDETTIDGDDAWSRRKSHYSKVWDDEEEEY